MRKLNAAQPIVFQNGTMQALFRDYLLRIASTLEPFEDSTGTADDQALVWNNTDNQWEASEPLGTAAFADIVGTVSESGGVPTGSIIERGSNANGEYVRFADGTQICWRQVDGIDINSAAGNVYTSGFQTADYPAAFSAAPAGSGAMQNTAAGWVNGRAPTASGGWVYSVFSYASRTGDNVNLLAIGRWF